MTATTPLTLTGPMPETFAISSFPAPALTNTTPTLRTVTLDELVKLLTKHERRRDKNGHGWSGAKYKPGTTRANANVTEWSVAAGDFDHLSMDDYMELRAGLVSHGLAVILYSTYNSAPEEFRFRLAIPLMRPIPKAQYSDIWHRMNAALFLGKNDENTKDASRMLFTPAAPADAVVVAEYIPGEALDWEKLPEAPASSRKSTLGAATSGQDVGVSKDVLWFTINGVEVGQQRRMALRAARAFLSAGKTVDETVDLIWRGLQASPVGDEADPWTEDEAREIVEDLADREPTPLEEWPEFPTDEPSRVREERPGQGPIVSPRCCATANRSTSSTTWTMCSNMAAFRSC